jgi:hypothetical protein
VDSVHGSWTSAGRGPRWTDHHGRPQSSTELGRAVALELDGPPEVAQRGEGCTGSPSQASPRRGQRRARHSEETVKEALSACRAWAQREEKESGERCGGG